MAEAQRRVTSSDVAAASGVSQATVSYVINNTPGQTISEPTRARVLRAAAELGYVPSFAGRTLRRGSTRNVLLDTTETPQGFEASFVNSFCDLLYEHGYTVAVIHASGSAPASLEDLSQALSPAAVVRLSPPTPEQVTFLRRLGVGQIAFVDFAPHDPRAGQMMMITGAAQIEHLVETGRRSIGYVLPDESAYQKVGFERAAGAGRRAKELRARFRVLDSASDLDSLCAVVDAAVTDARHPVDALACFNDQVGLQVLGALHRLGIGVPEQVAVIGVGDSAFAPYSVPPMTSVQVPAATFGTDMAVRVLNALGHDRPLVGSDAFTFSIARRDSA